MTRRRLVVLAALLLARPAIAGSGAMKGRVTSDSGPVANAAVLLDGPPLAAAPGAAHGVIDQRASTFAPRVLAVPVGTTVDFPNHDTVLHNVFSASPAKRFDLGMYDPGETRSVTFDAPGVVRIGCNVHPTMEAFVVVHTNPWVGVSDANGSYTVPGVPEGRYTLRVWHETLVGRSLPVTIHDGQVEAIDVRLAPPP